jgi:hypothetical protein
VIPAAPDDVWKAVEKAVNEGRWYSFPFAPGRGGSGQRWRVAESKPGSKLRLQAQVRAPGEAWLEVTVTPQEHGGSEYQQRAVILPRGVPGRLYWSVSRPLHAVALRALARHIAAR